MIAIVQALTHNDLREKGVLILPEPSRVERTNDGVFIHLIVPVLEQVDSLFEVYLVSFAQMVSFQLSVRDLNGIVVRCTC